MGVRGKGSGLEGLLHSPSARKHFRRKTFLASLNAYRRSSTLDLSLAGREISLKQGLPWEQAASRIHTSTEI
jgi:hypothetical protein